VADDPKTVPGMPTPTGAPSLPTAAATAPPAMPTTAATAIPPTAPPAMPSLTAEPSMPTTAATAIPPTAPPAMPSSTAEPSMPTAAGAPISGTRPPEMPFGTFQQGRGDAVPVPPRRAAEDRYRIGDEIARGGMGRVVEARDEVLGRVVAVKEALALDRDALQRFERETRITARLEHPAIVPVHDAGYTAHGAPYYVMRKIAGRPLEQLVARAERLDERLALLPHMVAASHAIAHAHERGIVHRDIKPSNILVGELGETIVIDWGLAKEIAEPDDPTISPNVYDPTDAIKTRAGIVYGTPGFMAPEQLRGKPVTERCDVYALGATLYHLLARKPPHFAKTADEMMRAAANAPPPPLTELVPGVPRELSTIIDKCLAHEAAARYQNARELAEDLNRFLTGQLVASHHYSARERARRFINKHKAPVGIAGGALVLLVAAFIYVVIQRERADAAAEIAVAEKKIAEAERARAQTELERVTLQQARNEVETNPTRAIAMIRHLAGKHPREVRSIAIAARAAGVAWGLPASKRTATLELARDGQRALAAGTDGVVRIYDFGKRTARIVLEAGESVSARFADGERRLVVWTGTKLAIVDAATGGRRDVVTPTAIRDLEVVGMTAYWIDVDRRLWALDLAGKVPLEIALAEPVDQLAPSPDGRWIALHGEDHLMLYDRTQPAAEPVIITNGNTVDADWSGDGKFLAALVDDSAIGVAMDPVPYIVHRRNVGVRRYVAWGNERVYSIGATGVSAIPAESLATRKPLVGDPIGIVEARGDTMIAASRGGIAILADSGDLALTVPAGHVHIIEASPRSPYVVATIEERLLVWNLDELQPRRIDIADLERVHFIGNDHALAATAEGPLQWIDLQAGKLQPFETRVPLRDVAGAPGGQLACVVDTARRAFLARPGHPLEALDGTISLAGFATDRDLLIADEETGTVHHLDVQTKQRTPLVARAAKLASVAWSRTQPAWVAAVFTDGTLWRKQLGRRDAETASSPVSSSSRLLVTADGTVFFAEGAALRAWRPDGGIDAHAKLAQPIVTLGAVGTGPLVAFTGDGAAYLVEVGARDRVLEAEPRGAARASMSADTGLYVVSNVDGIDLIDPVARHRWTLARAVNVAYRDPQISTDGRRVIAHSLRALLVWTLPDAPPPDATARWLDALTNAALDDTGRLGWL